MVWIQIPVHEATDSSNWWSLTKKSTVTPAGLFPWASAAIHPLLGERTQSWPTLPAAPLLPFLPSHRIASQHTRLIILWQFEWPRAWDVMRLLMSSERLHFTGGIVNKFSFNSVSFWRRECMGLKSSTLLKLSCYNSVNDFCSDYVPFHSMI